MNNNKIKVVWICHFSNQELNKKLPLEPGFLSSFMHIFGKRRKVTTVVPDFGIWNINAINEMKKFVDVIELHIIAPYHYLKPNIYEYIEDGIHYHFFKPSYALYEKLTSRIPALYNVYKPKFNKNRGVIKFLIEKIRPLIVHLIGAENPYYSISGLDVPKDIKLIVQLQTLMSDPKFLSNYPINKESYDYRVEVEKKVLMRADFIGTTILEYRRVISEYIDPKAKFLDFKLAVGETIRTAKLQKEYDFVYFARSISKAADWAIESFIEASKKKSGITLLVVGSYSHDEKVRYEVALDKYGLIDKVTFMGELSTHEDVLATVAKARVALLPIKFDYIPGTIREANALGLPVVTSITDGTPLLNEERQCVLLSEGGDCQTMSQNMIQVLEDPLLAEQLVRNSYARLQKFYDNTHIITVWVEGYKSLNQIG